MHVPAHCSAIALAIPVGVLLLAFDLSGPGDILCMKDHSLCCSVPDLGVVYLFVATNGLNPFNSKPVSLHIFSPNHHD